MNIASHALRNGDMTFFVLMGLMVVLLFWEFIQLQKKRYEGLPSWGVKASSEEEFLDRLLVAMKEQKKTEREYKIKAGILFGLGTVALVAAVLYLIR